MPVKKEWVVDEKRYHAKTTWEPNKASSYQPLIEDDALDKTADDKNKHLRLSEGVFLPGPEGFKFLKECKVKVKVELPPYMKNASITFKLYSLYNDGKEDKKYDHKFQVNGDTKDGYAEAVIEKLYYDENYANDDDKAPDAKCKYFFKASHPKAEKEIPSEFLEMPQENSEEKMYGGFELQKGDNDKVKKWGGKQLEKEGNFIAELQKDLFVLGYLITDGLNVPDKGKTVTYSGIFDKGLYSGLKTFQYEYKNIYNLTATGKLDSKTAKEIKKCREMKNFERQGISVDLSKIKVAKFSDPKPETPTKFYQLPPSPKHFYKRYGTPYVIKAGEELGDVYHNDIWGTKNMIDAVIKLSEKWTPSNDVIEIGDISLWKGGKMGSHNSHQDGFSIDIRTDSAGAMQKPDGVQNKYFAIKKSVEFAKAARDLGFGDIITMCPYVTYECNNDLEEYDDKKYVRQYKGHHHHFHMDFYPTITINLHYKDMRWCNSCIKEKSCSHYKNIQEKEDKSEN